MTAIHMKPLFKSYLKELSDTTLRGDAREESFYPALATLFSGSRIGGNGGSNWTISAPTAASSPP